MINPKHLPVLYTQTMRSMLRPMIDMSERAADLFFNLLDAAWGFNGGETEPTDPADLLVQHVQDGFGCDLYAIRNVLAQLSEAVWNEELATLSENVREAIDELEESRVP